MSRRQLASTLKEKLKAHPAVYEAVRTRRAARLEADYQELRDKYYERTRGLLGTDGGREAALTLLRKSRNVPRTKRSGLSDVRLFVVAADDIGGPRLLSSFGRLTDSVIFDLAGYRTPYSPEATTQLEWRDELQRDVVAAFNKAHGEEPIDLVFAYGSRFEFEPDTLQSIRSSGVPLAVLCLDDKHIFETNPGLPYPNGQKALIGAADVHLTNSRECVRWYLAEGAPAFYMPQGVDEQYYRPLDVPQDVDVSFVGQRYGYRASLVDHLSKSGVGVECYGSGWGTRKVSDDEKVALYTRSKVNLGIGGVGYSEQLTCIKGRDFEAPSAGGFYLTTYDAELADLFRIGEEIVCYRDAIDCAELIRYYLERPEEARRIAVAGRARCLRDHTWERRFEDFLGWIGLLEV